MKVKPFYQGKLDVFCAMYAVLNGLRITHGLRTLKARDLLNETLLGIASRPDSFRAVLEQKTDYVAIVDTMLSIQAKRLKLEVRTPFHGVLPDIDAFWEACREWLAPAGVPAQNRAILVRFSKYIDISKPPVVNHWTTIDSVNEKNMHLFDSSHDADAIQNLSKSDVVVAARNIDEKHKIYMQPDTVRFMGAA